MRGRPLPQGAGDVVMDFELDPPSPTPMTTIAWRLGHIAVVYGERAANHFGEGGVTYGTTDWPLDVAGMLALVDRGHDQWVAGRRRVSGPTAWLVHADRPRGRTPTTRSPTSCCTSTARSSTTAPRWR